MGHKVNPIGIRLKVVKDWNANWYAGGRQYSVNLMQDMSIREMIAKRLSDASVSDIRIERYATSVTVTIHTARPGAVIGKKGEDIERLKQAIAEIVGTKVNVNIEEIRKPELDASLIAENIARQLEKRIMFRRAMKRAMGNAMRIGAKGIKIAVSGRLNGADIARTEWYREGRVPLHTLRADISYGFCEADTTYGKIGIKVWVFLGEVFEERRAQLRAPARKASDVRRKKSSVSA